MNFQSTLGLGGTSTNLLGTITSRPQENIKVILKNDDAIIKKNRTKKRDKRSRKGCVSEEVVSRKKVRRNSVKEVKKPPKFVDKFGKENNKSADIASKEVFASGDNILVSVSFNNKSKTVTTTTVTEKTHSEETPTTSTTIVSAAPKTKSKRRHASPASLSPVSVDSEEPEKSRKHKKRKAKSRKEMSKGTVPLPMPPLVTSKRKTGEHMKPIAIIDLDKSPGKELTQSPKDVIVLSDSDGENKQSKNSSKDVIIIEHNAPDPPTRINKLLNPSNQLIEIGKAMTPLNTPPDSPLTSNQQSSNIQPVFKFSLKSKSNILPFNLLHDQAEEVDELEASNTNTNGTLNNSELAKIVQKGKESQENSQLDDKIPALAIQTEVYDPFEPTKSGSVSPATPPPNLHHLNDVSSSSDMLLSKNYDHESPLKSYTPTEHHNTTPKEVNNVQPLKSIEEHQISSSSVSIWNMRDLDKKAPSTSPLFNLFGAVNVLSKPSLLYGMEDALYCSDLKSTVAEPKQSQATVNFLAKVGEDNNIKLQQQQQQLLDDDNDLKSPYSPSSDGYNDFEAPPPSTSLAPIHSLSKNSQFDSTKHQHQSMDLDSSNNDTSSNNSYSCVDDDNNQGNNNNNNNNNKSSSNNLLKLTQSSLKSFNNSMRTSTLNYANKSELGLFDNYLPKSPPALQKRSGHSFMRTKVSRFSNINDNGSPAVTRRSNYHDGTNSKVLGKFNSKFERLLIETYLIFFS